MKRICSICARGGSKGVPGKNLREVAGKPLIAHSIDQARNTGLFDVLAVSSDDPDILDCARQHGVDILVDRPAALASDTAAKLPVIRHCVQTAEEATGQVFDVMVDLDATSPLRSLEDIKGAVALLESKDHACNVITAAPARRSPYFNMVEPLDDSGRVSLAKALPASVKRRQDAPACFDMNASIYVWNRACFYDETQGVLGSATYLFEMPEDRSLDIDTPLDFDLVRHLMERNLP